MNDLIKIKNILYIIISASLLGLLYNFLSDDGIKIFRDESIIEYAADSSLASAEFVEIEKESVIKGITTEQAYKMYKNNLYTFIDGRDQWEYGESHIKGSINIPEFSFEPDNAEVLALPKNNKYIIYCEGNDCDISKRLASEFIKLGFKYIYVYTGGFKEWLDAGYPIEGSTKK